MKTTVHVQRLFNSRNADAISITLAKSALPIGKNISTQVAANGILIVVFVNTLFKATISQVIGGWGLAKWSSSVHLVAFATGLIIHFIFLG